MILSYTPHSLYQSSTMEPFGVGFGSIFTGENFMQYIRELGIHSTKIYLYWHQIEPDRDVYDWSLVDEYLDQLEEGDEALLCIWTSSPWGAEGVGEGYPPLDYNEYYEFIYDLVKHTEGKIKYWQRDPEPASQNHWDKEKIEEYIETQKYFYNAVKTADPNAVVIDVSANGFFTNGEQNNAEFFEYILREGKDYFDLLDVRLYGDKYSIPERIQWFRDKMQEYGYEKPIVVTEYGGPTPFEFPEEYTLLSKRYRQLPLPVFIIWLYIQKNLGRLPPEMEMFLEPINEELEAKRIRIECRDITSRTILALWSGAEKCWWWNLVSRRIPIIDTPFLKIRIHHPVFGKLSLMEIENWSKKPTYYAYKIMVEKLQGMKNIDKINTGNKDIFLFKIDKDNGEIYVLWEKRDLFYGEEEPPTVFEFQTGFNKVLITNVFGEQSIIETENGLLRVNITDTPIYIEGSP